MQWSDRAGRRLKLRDLHILLAVSEHGSMAKAANELAISQPAVSKSIADMEHTVGLRLLDRGRHGIEPTIYGRALIKRGIAVFDELRHGIEELAFLADPAVGELRIGSTESMAAGVLPAVIDRFSRQYPRVTLNVVQTVLATLQYRELRQREVDLLLGRIAGSPTEDDLLVEPLFDERVVVMAGKSSRLARLRKLKVSDLIDERWILPPADSLAGVLAVEFFLAHGLEAPRAAVTTLSIHLCIRLLATGRFIATLPASILGFGTKGLPLAVLPVESLRPRPIGIVRLKNRTLNPIAQLFIQYARETTRQLQNAR